jgi:hypothetical protein
VFLAGLTPMPGAAGYVLGQAHGLPVEFRQQQNMVCKMSGWIENGASRTISVGKGMCVHLASGRI